MTTEQSRPVHARPVRTASESRSEELAQQASAAYAERHAPPWAESARLAAEPKLTCPRCGQDDVRLSRSRGLLDRLAAAAGFKPQRCRACRTRFFSMKHG